MRNPFIAGSWVRGDNFFGRSALLREVLDGERDSLWVVGARRLGKTSLLKELEWLVQHSTQTPWVPLYWDLEGSGDARGLADSLLGSVEDSEAYRRAARIDAEDVEGMPVADMLTTLVRKTVRSGWRLLLLIDEAEELLTVAQGDAPVLPKLRRVFQRGHDARAVMTSTRRLSRLDATTNFATSPFLQGFVPPLYLTPLAPDEARALLARGSFPDDAVDLVIERTACHPFLLQLIASRMFEHGDARAVVDQLAADEMVANFFSIDFQTLEPVERRILEELAREGKRKRSELAATVKLREDDIEPVLLGLRMMGYTSHDGARLRIGNWFFEHWLRRAVSAESSRAAAGGSVSP